MGSKGKGIRDLGLGTRIRDLGLGIGDLWGRKTGDLLGRGTKDLGFGIGEVGIKKEDLNSNLLLI